MNTIAQPTANVQPRLTVRQRAEVAGVSERLLYMANAVLRLRPDLAAPIEAGSMSVAEAYRIAKGKAKATSWDRLVSAWNNASDADRARLMAEADLVPIPPVSGGGVAGVGGYAVALCGSGVAR